jgi:hypothetical protein
MQYLANTFSPMMLGEYVAARVAECGLDDIPDEAESVIGHEVTAAIVGALLCRPVPFRRVNVALQIGDTLYAVIPAFRAGEAREFSHNEVANAGFRCFIVQTMAEDMLSPAY